MLISFWCDSDNKNYDFFTLQNFSGFFSFVHFDYHQNVLISYTPLLRVFLNMCSMHIRPKELHDNFFAFFSFVIKIQDGRQNLMSLSRACTASWICFMFGLTKRPYPAHVLICFWCDSYFLRFRILADISVLFILAIIKIC